MRVIANFLTLITFWFSLLKHYIGVNLFIFTAPLWALLPPLVAQRYVLGVVVWFLPGGHMRNTPKLTSFANQLVALTAVFTLFTTPFCIPFSTGILAIPVRSARKKLKKRSRRVKKHRRFITRRFLSKTDASASSWLPRMWVRYRTQQYFSRKLRRYISGYRVRLLKLSAWRRLCMLPTLSRRLRWLGHVLLLPRLHYYSGRWLRWPFVILTTVTVLPLIFHTFHWIVQDYDITYYNLFKDYSKAQYDLFDSRDPTSLFQHLKWFIAILFRMYLNGIESFYFYEHWVCNITFRMTTARLYLSSSWAYLFASLSIVAFFAGYGVQYWASWRKIRKHVKKLPRQNFTKRYYPVFIIRLKQYLCEYRRPVHPDKGRTDDWIYPAVLTQAHTAGYRGDFLNWLDTWIVAFKWSNFVFVLFVLACLILQGSAHVTKAITDRLFCAVRIPFLWFVPNLLLLLISVDLIHEVWTVWVAHYGPSKGIWGFAVASYKHMHWGGVAYLVFMSLLLCWWIAYAIAIRWRARKYAEFARSEYLSHRIKWGHSNRRAFKKFLDTFMTKRGGDLSHIYRPVLPAPRRKKSKPQQDDEND